MGRGAGEISKEWGRWSQFVARWGGMGSWRAKPRGETEEAAEAKAEESEEEAARAAAAAEEEEEEEETC